MFSAQLYCATLAASGGRGSYNAHIISLNCEKALIRKRMVWVAHVVFFLPSADFYPEWPVDRFETFVAFDLDASHEVDRVALLLLDRLKRADSKNARAIREQHPSAAPPKRRRKRA